MSLTVAFSLAPMGGASTESVSAAVAAAVRVVRASGLPNETNAMFTNIRSQSTMCFMRTTAACVSRWRPSRNSTAN